MRPRIPVPFSSDGFPLVDLHAHVEDHAVPPVRLSFAEASQRAGRLGVALGIAGEAGPHDAIRDDVDLLDFLAATRDLPLFAGLQAGDTGWHHRHCPDIIDRLDFVLADALILPDGAGPGIRLWKPDTVFADPGAFMERYVAHTLDVLAGPIDIWASPTFLPPSLQDRHEELWTPARRARVIEAAVRHQVAIEINARFRVPDVAFIREARSAGARFSLGTNHHCEGIGEIGWSLAQALLAGLRSVDFFLPERAG